MEKLYTVKSDVPIVRMGYAFSAMGYVLERIVKRFEETAFTSKEGIHDIVHYVMKDKAEKADLDKLVDVLLESRKPLVDFLAQGVFPKRSSLPKSASSWA